ncbi:MAG: hypothetical protein ACSHWU_07885 [Marinicella sp.]
MICLLVSVSIQANESAQWEFDELSINTQDLGVRVRANTLVYGDYSIKDVDYLCPESWVIFPIHQCDQAQFNFTVNGLAYKSLLDTYIDSQNNAWQVAMASENKSIKLALSSNSQQATVSFNDLAVSDLVNQIVAKDGQNYPDMTLAGELILDLEEMAVVNQGPIKFAALNYEYSEDVVVAELAGSLEFNFNLSQQHLNFSIQLNSGEMLFDQLYVDFSKYPVTLTGQLNAQSDDWYVAELNIENKQSLNLQTHIEFKDLEHWRNPKFTALIKDSHHFNQQILSSVLGIYGFGKSGMSGGLVFSAETNESVFDQWSLKFDDYYFLNEARKIAVEALNGEITWYKNQNGPDSSLSWQHLLMAGLPIETAAIVFNFSQDKFNLVGSQEFPVFDGSIVLQELLVENLFSEFIDMSLNASLVPISLKLITEKMGWPIMAGTISGEIPGMVKKGSAIKFLGALNLKVFNGQMQVDNLSMERLFGVAPVIAADVMFNDFDLSLLTETFGFGLITGNLSGTVNKLRITNWKTDRLDAEVYTVKTKGVKQIISQRAIENISSLGGISGAISKTFLRFFDDFKYKQIRLSCKLHNSVCRIGGIKNQNNQFVMVEGGGIPKINIVGFVRSINWEEFIDRLLNANYDN